MQCITYNCDGIKNRPDQIRLTVQNDYSSVKCAGSLIRSIASLKVMLEATDRTDEMTASLNTFKWTEEDFVDVIEINKSNSQPQDN